MAANETFASCSLHLDLEFYNAIVDLLKDTMLEFHCGLFKRFPHVLKAICFALLIIELIFLWFNVQFPSTKLVTWQVLPYILLLFLLSWAGQLVYDPEWAQIEVVCSLFFLAMSVANSVYLQSSLELRDINTGFVIALSWVLSLLWTVQLLLFSIATCFHFFDTKPRTSRSRKRIVRSLSPVICGVEPEEAEEEIYHGFHFQLPDFV